MNVISVASKIRKFPLEVMATIVNDVGRIANGASLSLVEQYTFFRGWTREDFDDLYQVMTGMKSTNHSRYKSSNRSSKRSNNYNKRRK